jgi:presenilin-like A22 family membrane protease
MNPLQERRSILLHGALIYAGTSLLALSPFLAGGIPAGGYSPSPSLSVPYVLLLFFLATAALIFALKRTKGGAVFEALFTLALLSGAWFLADVFLPEGAALVAGSAAILARFAVKNVLVSNLTLAVGIAGIAAGIGASIAPTALLVVLTVLVFYDIVAVYKTGHMVRMFRDLSSRGVLMAFAITPLRAGDLLRPAKSLDGAGGEAFFLGTGDVALPVMFAASVAATGLLHAAAAAAGSVAGFLLMFRLFTGQGRRRPMPALPPIALGTVAAYLLSLLFTN